MEYNGIFQCYAIVVNAFLSGCSKEWESSTYTSFLPLNHIYAFAQRHTQLALSTVLYIVTDISALFCTIVL